MKAIIKLSYKLKIIMKWNNFQFQNYPEQNNPYYIAISEYKCDFYIILKLS